MKKTLKNLLCSTVLLISFGISVMAEAGSIPTNTVPLQTYAYKKVLCYLQPGGTQKGYIDPGDYVIVNQIRSDGWAYGSYPVGKSRVSRWFKANDLVANVRFTNQSRYSPKNNTYVYRNNNHNSTIGSVYGNEPITVVSDSGNSRQIIYKLSNNTGYKMGWVPYWDCWTYQQAYPQTRPSNNPSINNNWDSKVGKVIANFNSQWYRGSNPFSWGQCTWYAWARNGEVKNYAITFSKNSGRHAKYWHQLVNNCKINTTLSSNCVAVTTQGGGGNGHVVYVEYVDNNNVYYTQANSSSHKNGELVKTSRKQFLNTYKYFIH